MSLPGFTAEASLYASPNHYLATTVEVSKSALVKPQSEHPLAPTSGLQFSSLFNCSSLEFCCLRLKNPSCCRSWRLLCFPE
ncbi:hypothetical protein NIES4071_12930 [Calothrix sp. NIES-4071]|nr:hypothetical protein NIES4071_12930 [Calothrix sp. NIES-4071]BAZ55633.1 hypothetical protein NIES4105_12890 [Calothrix sp. NIES-4105]